MTKVTVQVSRFAWGWVVLGCVAARVFSQQIPPKPQGPAESLYFKLRSVGLDQAKVYKIREGYLERNAIHISMDDGTIAFTQDVEGHVTGAFFEGDGEVLLSPPNTTERASLALFTGGAILEEKFTTAYFRFNDDVFTELKPFLRDAEDTAAFFASRNETAKTLAEQDALRLLLTFAGASSDDTASATNDHMLHAKLEGAKLGMFDLWYDTLVPEQIAAGQRKTVAGQEYYDLWTSFSISNSRKAPEVDATVETPNFDFDITKFNVQAEVTPPKDLKAKAVLSVVARKDCRPALVFELSRLLQVQDVFADGKPVEFIHNQAIEGSQLAKRGNDVVAVILPSALRAGQKIELVFDYSGSVLSEAASGLLYVGDRGTWYPNRGMAMASFDLQFRYPLGWTLVATGNRTALQQQAAQQGSQWTTDRLVPVAGFNLGKYSESVTYAGKIAVHTYATANVERGFPVAATPSPAPPRFVAPGRPLTPMSIPQPASVPTPSQNLRMVGSASANAVEFYERYFGPYPYRELAITQMPGMLSQGWPGLIFLSSVAFLNQEQRDKLDTSADSKLLAEQVIAHETAHQWWGDLVGWKTYRDQWIAEGLANYSALMLLESRDPAKFRRVLRIYRDELITKQQDGRPVTDAGPVTLGVRLTSSQFQDAYDTVCYGRGTWLLHMIRTMLRDAQAKSQRAGRSKSSTDEPFLRALAKLRTEYQEKSLSTADLLAVFESELPQSLWYEGHKSLAWFNNSWVNGTAVPSLSVHNVKFSAKGASTVATGTIVQDDAPDSLVTAVPLYASVGGRNVFVARVFAEGHETSFRLTVPANTRKLVLDPEQTVLARNH